MSNDQETPSKSPAGVNRRQFLATTAAAAAGFWIAGCQTNAQQARSRSPNEKLNIACIGVHGKGDSDSDHAGALGNIVALCDIDDDFLGKKGEKFPSAKRYNDYRKMFDEMSREIDAVVISTPDHMHAVQVMRALGEGKHVYCQKPLTHTVAEARLLRETAARKKLATQMGNQGTASNRFREGVEALRAGVIGNVTDVHVWTNRPVWPQSPEITQRPEASEPPANVHWDLWLGSAPVRPYSGVKAKNGHAPYHDFNWRGWRDFGCGALGDMGCHTANLPFMGLDLDHPKYVFGESEEVNPEIHPGWARVRFEFAARGNRGPVTVNWYEGRKDGKLVLPPQDLIDKALAEFVKAKPDAAFDKEGKPREVRLSASGSLIVGDKGMLYSPNDYGTEWYLLPAEQYQNYKTEKKLARLEHDNDEGHKLEWLIAARGGPKAFSNFEYAGLLTEFILLGNIAIQVPHTTLAWDAPAMKFDDAKATSLLSHPYRRGFELRR